MVGGFYLPAPKKREREVSSCSLWADLENPYVLGRAYSTYSTYSLYVEGGKVERLLNSLYYLPRW